MSNFLGKYGFQNDMCESHFHSINSKKYGEEYKHPCPILEKLNQVFKRFETYI